MKLPSLPFFEKKEKPEYLLSLILLDEKIKAVVFKKLSQSIKPLSEAEEVIEKNIEDLPLEDFLNTLDRVITKAEDALPQNIKTEKTVFGLKENWVEEDKIKKEYLEKLKRISHELDLSPIGFLVMTEAILSLLKTEDGAPVSAILTNIHSKTVTVYLVKAGKIIEQKTAEIHENVPFTVDTLLKHFEIPEILPAKIIILNTQDEDIAQEFIAHHWSKSLPFLHVPQITTLSKDFDTKSMLYGAATQMGLDVLAEFKKENDEVEVLKKPEEVIGINKNETIGEDSETLKTEEDEKDNIKSTLQGEEEFFGFKEGIDVAEIKNENTKKELENQKSEEEGKVIKKEANKPETAVESPTLAISEKEEEGEEKNSRLEQKKAKSFKFPFNLISLIALIKIPYFKGFSGFNSLSKKFLLIPILLIFVLSVFGFLYFQSSTATIILKLNPKVEEYAQTVTFSSSSSTELSKKIIGGETITITQEGSSSMDTTGKKEVGTESKGIITIFSRFTSDKTFAEGTSVSYSDLEFTMDNSAKTSSASADASAQPSTVTVAVTAKEIGKDHNLPSGTKFSIGSFSTSDVIAKNENPFSGGTKKEITIVSKKDQEKLLEKVTKDLESKAKEELSKKISDDKIILPVFITSKVSKKTFDKDLDEEANKLSVKATIEYEAVAYKKEDLMAFAKSALKDRIPDDLTIDEKDIEIIVKDSKRKSDEEVSASIKIKALLLPKIENKLVLSQVSGQSEKSAKAKLLAIPQVENVTIKFSPNIPFLPRIMPRNIEKIKIELVK
ncbi:baseplate J/gp47 family protein [Patescibacteria group bacterium]|nr:baseplate J/gp47 family protein [Patescibacteria group bacterium]